MEIFRIAIFSGSNRCLMVTSPNCCVKMGMFSLSVDERVLKKYTQEFLCLRCASGTDKLCVCLSNLRFYGVAFGDKSW